MEYSHTIAEGRLVGHEFWESELQRDTTLIAATDCVLGWLNRSDFQNLMHHFVRTETEKRLPGMMVHVFKEQVNLTAARRICQVLVRSEAYFQAGKQVFASGHESDHVYLISKGMVKLVVATPPREKSQEFDRESFNMLVGSLKGAKAPPHVLVEVGVGEFFGEEEALLRRRRTHSAVCATDCCLMSIPTAQLSALMGESPSLLQFMTRQSGQKRQNNEEHLRRFARANLRGLPSVHPQHMHASTPTQEDEKTVLQAISRLESKENRIPRKDFVPLSKKRIAQYLSKPKAFWDQLDSDHAATKKEHVKYMDRWIYRKDLQKQEQRLEKAKSAREKQTRFVFANYVDSQDDSSLEESSRAPLESSQGASPGQTALPSVLQKSAIDRVLLSKLLHRTKALDGVLDTDVGTSIKKSLSNHAAADECSVLSSLVLDSRMCKSMDQNRSQFETEVSDREKSSQRAGKYDSREKNKSILASLRNRERAKFELLTKKLQPVSLRRGFIRPSPSKLASNSVFE